MLGVDSSEFGLWRGKRLQCSGQVKREACWVGRSFSGWCVELARAVRADGPGDKADDKDKGDILATTYTPLNTLTRIVFVVIL